MFKTKYRIVTDEYLGYEAQFRWWWLPVWLQMGFTNTHLTLEEARGFIRKKSFVEYVE